jgi:hypothetical protein
VGDGYRGCLAELDRHGLLPSSYEAVYVGGSRVRGWGNERSDLDIYVIVAQPWRSDSAQIDTVALHPDTIPVEVLYVDKQRWDVEYWLESQVDQLFAKVGPDQLEGGQQAGRRMTYPEVCFLERIGYAGLVGKDEWVRARQRQLEGLPVDSVMALRALHMMDIYTEDVVGQLAAGDVVSAVLTAKIALRYAVDALLASHGEFGESLKWFAHRFRAADPPELDFDEYWALETMRSFDPAAPEQWIEEVLMLCRRISSEVRV